MGRKKVIEDDALISLIDEFFLHECNSTANALKLPQIAEYIKRSGYPEYAVETLRRNAIARGHIDKLKESADEHLINTLVCYNTLDADDFLTKHPTRKSLIAALTHLDAYYSSIATSAVALNKKSNLILDEHKNLNANYQQARQDIGTLTTTVNELKQTIKLLKTQNKTLRSIIDTYVYPAVADALLKDSGILPADATSGIIDPEKLDKALITGDTIISAKDDQHAQNNVIQSLFNQFDP